MRRIRFIGSFKRSRTARPVAVAAAILASLALTACGAASSLVSAGAADSALSNSFSGAQKITSGNLQLSLTLTPQGSSIFSTPITLAVSGPFQRASSGSPAQFDLSASLSAIGQNLSFGIISTGTGAYVTLQGAAYQLPASVTQLLSSTSSSDMPAAGKLSKLGLEPLSWLVNPTVVGTETVAGTTTTHVHAGISLKALIANLGSAFSKSSDRTRTLPASFSGLIAKVESAVQNPTLDTWTGTSDNILRKAELAFTVSLAGLKLPSILSGLSAVNVDLTAQINDLNQPQTITAPSSPQPFSAFLTQVKALLGQLSSIPGLSGILGGANGGALGSLLGGSSSKAKPGRVIGVVGVNVNAGSPASRIRRYSRCVQRAGSSAASLQKCTKLLSSG